ncbi:TniQ family protein [Lysobacter sp. CCNWLW3]|uniref:TniQ family protein n=1 Tax=unclassified Lysobacter TaxID=2635362 RepID=UPI002FD49B53
MGGLTLRVDPPYEGESLSSVIGRAAQFYGTPLMALLADLGRPAGSSYRTYDLDFRPHPLIESCIGDAVPNWRSPVDGHRGFHHWVLGSSHRTSYCVRCFEEDLALGRTPYFRLDWAPVLVTSCWKHRVPLFNWLDVSSGGMRRLPRAWVQQTEAEDAAPSFFLEHRRKLDDLLKGIAAGTCARISVALDSLDVFQRLMEKQSQDDLLVLSDDDPAVRLRELGYEMIISTMRFWRQQMVNRTRPATMDETFEAWFDPFVEYPERVRGSCLNSALRRAWDLGWRRSYFLFAAQAFAPQYGQGASNPWWAAVPKLGHA